MIRNESVVSATVESGRGLRLVLLLAAAAAMGPLSMQIFLPALPFIQDDFGASTGLAQLAFSAAAIAIAIATLFYGPISDMLGRRPALLGGLVVYLIGSLMCLLAPTIGWMILGRIVQAAGGCAGIVLSRAIIRDLYDREESAAMIAYVTMGMVSAPMLAPAIGGVITELAGWRWIFVLGGGIGVAVLALTMRSLPETAPGAGTRPDLVAMLRSFGQLLRHRAYVGYALQSAFAMALFFSLLAGAPYLMIRVYGRSAVEYGLFFLLISGSYILGNFAAARLTRHVGTDRMIVVGSCGALAAVSLALLLAVAGFWNPFALFLPLTLGTFAQGLAMPNSNAAFVSVDPARAGAASGLGGFLQMGLAGAMAQIVGMSHNGTPYPTVIAMTACGIVSLGFALMAIAARERVRIA